MKLTRIALSAASAALIVLGSGATAFAADPNGDGYRAPGITITITDSTPGAGQTITIVIQGKPGQRITLTITSSNGSTTITIAGEKALTKTADANGLASFDVTLGAPGTFTAVATDADTGAVLGTSVLTVGGGTTASGSSLASTGSDELPVVLGAAALVVVGTGSVLLVRRRRATHEV